MEWVRGDGPTRLRIALGAEVDAIDVYPAASIEEGGPPVLTLVQSTPGQYEAESDGSVLFTPRYPFVPGTEYAVVARVRGEPRTFRIRHEAERSEPTTSVVAIRPALDEVPRNLLRLYVEFSAPMSEGCAPSAITLVDADTRQPLVDSLLPFEPELWDPHRRRLTVLLDPSRIKRGLAPHLGAGYPLVEGRRVELMVDAGFLDAGGCRLVEGAVRAFAVGPDLRGLVDPHRWSISAPQANTTATLAVTFDRPLDVALLAHCLAVLDEHGRLVEGGRWAAPDGRTWAFEPYQPWAPGRFALLVDPILEDVAGNSVQRVFDRDLDDPADDPRSGGHPTVVEFQVS